MLPPSPPYWMTSPPASPSVSNERRSPTKSCHFSPHVPVLTIIPPTLPQHLPTPPLTPLTPLTPCLKTSSRKNSFFHDEPSTDVLLASPTPIAATTEPLALATAVPLPSSPSPALAEALPIPTGHETDHALHAPLVAHLALLHPSTPREVIHFCATRLLSPDRPFGFDTAVEIDRRGTQAKAENEREKAVGKAASTKQKEWTPLWAGIGDLATAGLGREAAKGCEQVGPGKEIDEKLEWMYGVARRSWEILVVKAPGRGGAL
ncbi:uncharacterized protein MKK02DRAFT_33480 [Dioszegia hungarica]|uniref:Uncharacterized protein n=1 Tax=Dioszegia hungarica TaxID=4972 RepID=A0AA38LW26_9TREE|nr:uncharacterized protein MKK02DRAFT_33480 [Dioszegia hungarica]KAI9636239.1 hypothetical protein MKK02DRAFT_33480 [Dioszegia hungarica]